ncbi:MAG: hypothetical protein C4557_11190 [Anaerolineaceae bacterium]|nr:MAG: hypothetical protein C4557_11190 [Anaerolineaceae bacterium]
MQSLTLHTRVGKDGILKLEMPSDVRDTELEIVLIFSPVLERAADWTPDFFTEVIGGWQGEPLVREPQGQYETRDELK